MNRQEYLKTQETIVICSSWILGQKIDFDGFFKRIEKAETLGPILDPTLFQRGAGDMEKVKRLAEALQTYQQEVKKIKEAK